MFRSQDKFESRPSCLGNIYLILVVSYVLVYGFIGLRFVNKNNALRGVKTEETRKGNLLGGAQGYLGGIFGDTSLTQIQGKVWTNLRKYKNKLRKA